MAILICAPRKSTTIGEIVNNDPGILLTIEGGEGAGKGTQIEMLIREMQALEKETGIQSLVIREPGGTRVGEEIRKILLQEGREKSVAMCDKTELLLFGGARAQLVLDVIVPALNAGHVIICDRFYDSTDAYQGFGRGLDLEFIAFLNRFVTDGIIPNLTLYFDIDPKVGLKRAKNKNGKGDRIEEEVIEFHQRVRKGFLWKAEQEPDRFKIIDATGTPEEVHERVMQVVMPIIEARIGM